MIGEMKREALYSLKGKWGLGVGSTILYFIYSLFWTALHGLLDLSSPTTMNPDQQ